MKYLRMQRVIGVFPWPYSLQFLELFFIYINQLGCFCGAICGEFACVAVKHLAEETYFYLLNL